jgi:hypothetical protein
MHHAVLYLFDLPANTKMMSERRMCISSDVIVQDVVELVMALEHDWVGV